MCGHAGAFFSVDQSLIWWAISYVKWCLPSHHNPSLHHAFVFHLSCICKKLYEDWFSCFCLNLARLFNSEFVAFEAWKKFELKGTSLSRQRTLKGTLKKSRRIAASTLALTVSFYERVVKKKDKYESQNIISHLFPKLWKQVVTVKLWGVFTFAYFQIVSESH